MCKVYGYARISTSKQSIDRQVRNILAEYPSAVIVKEAFTGTKVEGRAEFAKLLRRLQEGDTIVFDSVSRMSRNASEGFELYKRLFEQGIELVFLKEHHIDTATYKREMEKKYGGVHTGDEASDKMLNQIMSAVTEYTMALAARQIRLAFEQSEKEVTDLHQRTREGIETARLNGKQIGQQQGRKLNVKKAAAAKELIRKHSKTFGGSMDDAQMLRLAQISKPTLYKYKREILEALRAEQAESMEQV